MTSNPTLRARNTEIEVPVRAAVVALRHNKLTWTEISIQLHLRPTTALMIYQRARERAGSEDLLAMLNCVYNAARGGAPVRFPEGSDISEALFEASQRDPEHQDLPIEYIAEIVSEESQIYVPREVARATLLRDHGVVRRRPPRKIHLEPHHRAARVTLANWALPKVSHDIFVFTDEMSVNIEDHRRNPAVSRPIGANQFDYSRPPRELFKTVMFWGAIAIGYGTGLCYIFEKETEDERAHIDAIVEQENDAIRDRVATRRRLALIPGTDEHRVLQEINVNVQRRDVTDPLPSGRKRRRRPPQWEFGEELQKRDRRNSKGGVDWARYRETILRPLLYPWALQIQEETGRRVWIVEDNASPHATARRFTVNERHQQGVHVVDWPPRSPDLNKIERIWDHVKGKMANIGVRNA